MKNRPRRLQPSSQQSHHYQSHPNHLSQNSYTSSSDQDNSQSISIQLKAKIDQIKSKSENRKIEQELTNLRIQNQDLRQLNQKLSKELQQLTSRFSRLEGSLKQKQKDQNRLNMEIQKLKLLQSQPHKPSNNSFQKKKRVFQIVQQKGKMNHLSKKHKPNTDDNDQSSGSDDEQSLSSSVHLHIINQKNVKQNNAEYEQQIMAWQQRLAQYQKQMRWQMSLAQKMNKMAKDVSYIFGDKVCNQKWDMRKRSKASWRYLKHIMKYMLLYTQ